MQVFLYIALFSFSLFIAVYGLYYLLVLETSKRRQYQEFIDASLEKNLNVHELPNVSILVPAHNEEEVILNKFNNIAAFDYPHEKLEVILIDDCSEDKTAQTAERMLKDLDLNGKVLRNNKRLGVNGSYNRGMVEIESEVVLMTDADVMIEPDALMKGVKILKNMEYIGGISGRMVPLSSSKTAAVSVENSYRNFYDQMSIAESAIDSTYPGYTCLALVRKSVFLPLNESYGSSDGNLSLSVILQGWRFIYVPQLIFYENVASRFKEQRRQKIRRATRLLQSTLTYSKNLFNRRRRGFTKLIFPLRLLMIAICPIFFWIGLISLFTELFTLSYVLMFISLGLFVGLLSLGVKLRNKILNLFSSFVVHQFYLLSAIVLSPRKSKTWKAIERNTNSAPIDAPNAC